MNHTSPQNTATNMNTDNTSPVSKISTTSSAIDRNVTIDDVPGPTVLDKHLKIVIVHPL